MKIIQPAKFTAGPYGSAIIEQPAEVEIGNIRLFSKTPKTGAEAAQINQELERVFTVTEATV